MLVRADGDTATEVVIVELMHRLASWHVAADRNASCAIDRPGNTTVNCA